MELTGEAKDIVEALERGVLAGATAIDNKRSTVEVRWKEDNTVVMNLDIASQEALRASLGSNIPILSEEDPDTHHLIGSKSPYLVLDPLDGTASCRRILKNHDGEFVNGQVGCGPLTGYIKNGRVTGCVFYSLTERALYSAWLGKGVYRTELLTNQSPPPYSQRERLKINRRLPLRESAVLYYPGKRGEVPLVQILSENDLVDTIYRFGGFANDCTRLARGFEQVHIQFSLKAWDLPAALLGVEAGMAALLDPLGRRIALSDWDVAHLNPILLAPSDTVTELLKELELHLKSRN